MPSTQALDETPAVPANPYLTGVHTPMKEELTIEDLPVTGAIPAALDGRYLRLGPNPMAPNAAKYHWFAGDGMIHGLRIKDGRALWYRNRWIRSDAVSKALGEPRHAGAAARLRHRQHQCRRLRRQDAGRWSRRAARRSRSARRWRPCATPISTAPCMAASPRIRTSIR